MGFVEGRLMEHQSHDLHVLLLTYRQITAQSNFLQALLPGKILVQADKKELVMLNREK